MSKFTVYQINFTDEQENEINTSESRPAFYLTYLDTIMSPTDEAIAAARDMYKKVAVIEADSFDGVFQVGNIGPEQNIERLAPMHSLSVGDIIVADAGEAVYVAPYGFNPITL
ncbi:MAG: hypothetical protein ACO2Z7_07680 [Burkholderiaceae bacterium]